MRDLKDDPCVELSKAEAQLAPASGRGLVLAPLLTPPTTMLHATDADGVEDGDVVPVTAAELAAGCKRAVLAPQLPPTPARPALHCRLGLHPALGSSSSRSSTSSSSSLDALVPSTPSTVSADAELAAEPAEPGQRAAFVTLLTRESYLTGVQALARSLQAVGTRHPLLVMYTADTLDQAAVEALRAEAGCQPVAVERYVPPGPHDFGAYKLQLYAECWTKLRMWELEQFDRLVYLDADMLVLRNIDDLHDLPPGFYAAPDCTAGRPCEAEQEACPLFCPQQPHYFNAGFFVMTPCAAELAHFGGLLEAGAVPIGGYAEQDFLNECFKGCWQPLPHTFNCQKGIKRHHPELWRRHWHEVAVLHYTDAKPWHKDHPDHEQHAELVDLWWRVYEQRWQGPASPVS